MGADGPVGLIGRDGAAPAAIVQCERDPGAGCPAAQRSRPRGPRGRPRSVPGHQARGAAPRSPASWDRDRDIAPLGVGGLHRRLELEAADPARAGTPWRAGRSASWASVSVPRAPGVLQREAERNCRRPHDARRDAILQWRHRAPEARALQARRAEESTSDARASHSASWVSPRRRSVGAAIFVPDAAIGRIDRLEHRLEAGRELVRVGNLEGEAGVRESGLWRGTNAAGPSSPAACKKRRGDVGPHPGRARPGASRVRESRASIGRVRTHEEQLQPLVGNRRRPMRHRPAPRPRKPASVGARARRGRGSWREPSIRNSRRAAVRSQAPGLRSGTPDARPALQSALPKASASASSAAGDVAEWAASHGDEPAVERARRHASAARRASAMSAQSTSWRIVATGGTESRRHRRAAVGAARRPVERRLEIEGRSKSI